MKVYKKRMDMVEVLLLVVLGLVAGVFSGMFGIGGGSIIVPILIYAWGVSQTEANGTSLAILLMPVGILAALSYYRAQKLEIKVSALIALGLTIGSYFGAELALNARPLALMLSYVGFLMVVSVYYINPRSFMSRVYQKQRVNKLETDEADSWSVKLIPLMIGLVAGVLSGLFGIGGGLLIVPALVIIMGFSQKVATGTSLGALLLPVGLPGVLRYSIEGKIDFGVVAPIAIGIVFGAIVGATITLGLSDKTVRRLYGGFLFLVALRFLFTSI